MKKLTVFALVALLLVSVFAFAGCKPEESGDVLKVGLVCIGSKDDKGYTYAHARGMVYAESCFNGKVKIYYRDNVDDGDPAKTTAAIESLINDDGCTLIFTNSFGFMEPTAQAAEKYPNVKFMHCSGYKSNDTNFGNYFGRAYQARYLAGIAAGKATVTNKIGYVAAKQLTECYRGINAFTLGVKSVNPDATVYVKWTDTWYDPIVERSAALALLDGGCDVIAQHQDTTDTQQVFLLHTVFPVAAIQLVSDGTVPFAVLGDISIHQVQRNTSNVHFPNICINDTSGIWDFQHDRFSVFIGHHHTLDAQISAFRRQRGIDLLTNHQLRIM